ncbi:pimeloyl-[acyl-carrier protein] methyl ester esterase, partial [Vibrio cholerae]|nr:pimeloyl-[acyl-carrier protein] methyl ester esterase [Vibrio cholerae]
LKEAVLALPAPSTEVLAKGLDLLADTDHRPLLAGLSMPALRIYGRLDALVPQQVVDGVSRYWPQSQAQILTESAHAPFIAQPRDCAALIEAFCSSSQPG